MKLINLTICLALLIITKCNTHISDDNSLRFSIDSSLHSELKYTLDSNTSNKAGIKNINAHVLKLKEIQLLSNIPSIRNAKLLLLGLDFADSVGIFYTKGDSLLITNYQLNKNQLISTSESSKVVLTGASKQGDTVTIVGRKLFKELTFIIDTVKTSPDSINKYSLELIPIKSTMPGMHRAVVRSLVIDRKGKIYSIVFGLGEIELLVIGFKIMK